MQKVQTLKEKKVGDINFNLILFVIQPIDFFILNLKDLVLI